MCKPAKALGSGLGTIFTGGLNKTGLPFFKKAGDVVGTGLTLGANKLSFGGGGGGGGGGGFGPSLGSGTGYSTQDKNIAEADRLAKIFAPVQEAQFAGIESDTGDAFKKLRASQAARGVLRSGVADYPGTELLKGEGLAKGTVRSGLANILGTTEAQRSLFGTQADFLREQAATEYQRNLELADKIAKANKKSTLSQIFEGVNTFGPLAGKLFGAGGALSGIFGGGGGGGGAAATEIGGFF